MAIDFSKRPKGMSKREYAASVLGGTKNDYNEDGSPRSGGSSSGGNNLSSIVDEILRATPGFNSPSQSFDDFYNEKQQAEDQKASEALFNPWYEQQISDTMEDLNSYIEMDSVSYKRTLRQGRAKMAQLGGAIGSERTNWEGDVTDEMERTKNQRLRNTERMVGSDAMLKAGYQSFYGGGRVGTLIDERNAAIEDQKLWYRDQAMGQYNSSANATYQRPSNLNFLGGRL